MKELILIQSQLKAPRGQLNKFGNYKYRSCEDILEAVKPLLKEQNCRLNLSDEVVVVGDRYYVKAIATIATEKDVISVTAYAREEETKKGMDGSQITGTASSYARKYALNGLFCIDDTKDADTDEYYKKTGNKEDIEANDKELKILEQVANCTTIEEVKAICAKEKGNFRNVNDLINAFKKKEAELSGNI